MPSSMDKTLARPCKIFMSKQEKALDVQNVEDAKAKVSDIKVVGNGDTFALLCKASSKSQGWMKSAKAMEVPGGCVMQVTTQQGDNVAEALLNWSDKAKVKCWKAEELSPPEDA